MLGFELVNMYAVPQPAHQVFSEILQWLLWGILNEERLKNGNEGEFGYGDIIGYGDVWVIKLDSWYGYGSMQFLYCWLYGMV